MSAGVVGFHRRRAPIAQPLARAASIPATGLFPCFFSVNMGGALGMGSITLMLLGRSSHPSNVIADAMGIHRICANWAGVCAIAP